ncbi:MAG: hypothetical protein GY778_27440, partial [bacterium]|nr:hypothetical protein [bacterium]
MYRRIATSVPVPTVFAFAICVACLPAALGQELGVRWTAPGHRGSVHGVVFSPNGEFAASASSDTTVKVWRPANGKLVRTLLPPHGFGAISAAFAPAGL